MDKASHLFNKHLWSFCNIADNGVTDMNETQSLLSRSWQSSGGDRYKNQMLDVKAQTPSTNFLPWAQNSTLAFCRSTVRASLGYGRVLFSHYLVSVAALGWFQSPTVVLYSWVCLAWRSWSRTGLNLKTDLLWLLVWGPFSKLSIHPCWLRLSYLDGLRTKKRGFCPCSVLCHLIQSFFLALLRHAVLNLFCQDLIHESLQTPPVLSPAP